MNLGKGPRAHETRGVMDMRLNNIRVIYELYREGNVVGYS
jgi:hypothetical protein